MNNIKATKSFKIILYLTTFSLLCFFIIFIWYDNALSQETVKESTSKESQLEEIITSGKVFIAGNEPFTSPAIKTKDGMIYGLESEYIQDLKSLQGAFVEVRGYVIFNHLSGHGIKVNDYRTITKEEADKKDVNLIEINKYQTKIDSEGKYLEATFVNNSSHSLEIYSTSLVVTTTLPEVTIQYIKAFNDSQKWSVLPSIIIDPLEVFTIKWDVSAKNFKIGDSFKAIGSILYRLPNDIEPRLYDDKVELQGLWR